MNTHKQKTIIHPVRGIKADIDAKLVKVIQLCWKLNIETLYSCEGSLRNSKTYLVALNNNKTINFQNSFLFNLGYIKFKDLDALKAFLVAIGCMEYRIKFDAHSEHFSFHPVNDKTYVLVNAMENVVRFPYGAIKDIEQALYAATTTADLNI